MYKAAKKAIIRSLILRNYNTEMLNALVRKKEHINQKGEKIAKEDT